MRKKRKKKKNEVTKGKEERGGEKKEVSGVEGSGVRFVLLILSMNVLD